MEIPGFVSRCLLFDEIDDLCTNLTSNQIEKHPIVVGRLLGFTVVVLKACTVIPLLLISTIVATGVLLTNTAGTLFSAKCRQDLSLTAAFTLLTIAITVTGPVSVLFILLKGGYTALKNPAQLAYNESFAEDLGNSNPVLIAFHQYC